MPKTHPHTYKHTTDNYSAQIVSLVLRMRHSAVDNEPTRPTQLLKTQGRAGSDKLVPWYYSRLCPLKAYGIKYKQPRQCIRSGRVQRRRRELIVKEESSQKRWLLCCVGCYFMPYQPGNCSLHTKSRGRGKCKVKGSVTFMIPPLHHHGAKSERQKQMLQLPTAPWGKSNWWSLTLKNKCG